MEFPGPVAERCPNAVRCVDPFHVIKLATDALDEIRRDVWNQARRDGDKQAAKELKGARFVLWKNPGKLSDRQRVKLAHIQQTNQPLYRAYLISQQLRDIYRVGYEEAVEMLDYWLIWARRCRLAPFVKLARTITNQRPGIEAAIQNGLSNARAESIHEQPRQADRPPRLRISLRQRRTRTRSPHLRTRHTHTPTRTSVRVTSPTAARRPARSPWPPRARACRRRARAPRLAQTITNYSSQQAAYTAALRASVSIVQSSLLDFLK